MECMTRFNYYAFSSDFLIAFIINSIPDGNSLYGVTQNTGYSN